MQRKYVIGSVLLVAGFVLVCLALSVPAPAPPVVGADGESGPVAAVPWGQLITMFLSVFGGGSLAAAIKTFWSKAEPFVTPILNTMTPNPTAPVVVPAVVTPAPVPAPVQVKDAEEFVAAAIAYQKDKANLALLRRFAMASNTEVFDAIGVKSPKVAAAVNNVLTELINEFIPVPADQTKAA